MRHVDQEYGEKPRDAHNVHLGRVVVHGYWVLVREDRDQAHFYDHQDRQRLRALPDDGRNQSCHGHPGLEVHCMRRASWQFDGQA
eukprot:CAMPEP_0183500548 /NCGR_PEP_ID=MMETSP0371-20130417/2586_1 /TAXON_ID=268820 /ORGANISM="Peridinium aciculiferum, Strain PAER-2" /LENGTH=84 /DNA_ID=CAMNT_0025694677 /DNA_START=9 /DNA_END=260 /DNA_ORIENTATION=+